MLYLAQPYSHSDPKVREERYQAAVDAIAYLMLSLKDSRSVYSPIITNHPIAVAHDLPKEAFFWMDKNFSVIDECEGVMVLPLEGWETSNGLAAELAYAKKIKTPVSWISMPDFETFLSGVRK